MAFQDISGCFRRFQRGLYRFQKTAQALGVRKLQMSFKWLSGVYERRFFLLVFQDIPMRFRRVARYSRLITLVDPMTFLREISEILGKTLDSSLDNTNLNEAVQALDSCSTQVMYDSPFSCFFFAS